MILPRYYDTLCFTRLIFNIWVALIKNIITQILFYIHLIMNLVYLLSTIERKFIQFQIYMAYKLYV